MITGRLEHRRNVERVGAKVSNIGKFLDNARDIATEKIVVINRIRAIARIGFVGFIEPIFVKLNAFVLIGINTRFGIIARIAVAETIGEDIVINCVLCPGRHRKISGVHGMPIAANAFA